jgi:hypothetical protein
LRCEDQTVAWGGWCSQSHRGETLLLQVDKTTTAKQIKELMEVGKPLPLRAI